MKARDDNGIVSAIAAVRNASDSDAFHAECSGQVPIAEAALFDAIDAWAEREQRPLRTLTLPELTSEQRAEAMAQLCDLRDLGVVICDAFPELGAEVAAKSAKGGPIR